MDSLAKYLRETFAELKQVKWPTQNQALVYTGLIIGICVTLGVFVGLLDFVLADGINAAISHFGK